MTDSMKQVMIFLSVTITGRFSKFQVYKCLKTIYALLLQLNVNLHLYLDIAINCHSPFQPPVFLWTRVAARLKSLILYHKSNTTDMGLLLKVPDINPSRWFHLRADNSLKKSWTPIFHPLLHFFS